MFTNIINPFIKTRNQVKNKKGVWVDEKKPVERHYTHSVGDITIGDNGYIVFDTDKKVIIDAFQFSCNHSGYMYPRLHAKRELDVNGRFDSNLFVTTNHSGLRYDATPAYVANNGHPLLESSVHDTGQGRYKMMNKAPIILPEGGKLGVYVSSSYNPSNHTIALAVVWREIEE